MVAESWTLKSDKAEALAQMEHYSTSSVKSGRSGSGIGVGGIRSGGLVTLFEKFQLFCILSLIIILSPCPSAPMTMMTPTELRNPEQEQVDFDKPNKQQYPEQPLLPWLAPKPDFDDNSQQILSEGGLKRDNLNSVAEAAAVLQANQRLSRAFDRIHFAPWLKTFRPITTRAASTNFPQEKKALSFFSRFYPVLQHGSSGGGESDSLMTDYTPRRRVSFPHSGESLGTTRFSRPIMRLRWGK